MFNQLKSHGRYLTAKNMTYLCKLFWKTLEIEKRTHINFTQAATGLAFLKKQTRKIISCVLASVEYHKEVYSVKLETFGVSDVHQYY